MSYLWKVSFIMMFMASGVFAVDRDEVDQLLKDYSGTILLAKGEKIYMKEAYGEADRTQKTPITIDTPFPIASVTKTITATVLLKLLHEKNIPLETEVCKYLKEFPKDITIKDLLTHQSGLHLYTDFNHPDEKRSTPLSREKFYEMLFTQRAPKEFSYNNGNFMVLEDVLKSIAGQEYADYLRETLLEPLGMHRTGVLTRTQEKESVIGYTKEGKNALPIDYSWLGAGAGLYSTAGDLHLFLQALLNEKILSKELMNVMFQDHGGNYGLGWTMGELASKPIRYHEGGIDGFSTMLMIDPQDYHILVMLSNEQFGIDTVSEKLFSKMMK